MIQLPKLARLRTDEAGKQDLLLAINGAIVVNLNSNSVSAGIMDVFETTNFIEDLIRMSTMDNPPNRITIDNRHINTSIQRCWVQVLSSYAGEDRGRPLSIRGLTCVVQSLIKFDYSWFYDNEEEVRFILHNFNTPLTIRLTYETTCACVNGG